MRRVGHDAFQQESVLVEKMRADVQERDVFHVFEQTGEIGVEFADLLPKFVGRLGSPGQDGEDQDFGLRVELSESADHSLEAFGGIVGFVAAPSDIVGAEKDDGAFGRFLSFGR